MKKSWISFRLYAIPSSDEISHCPSLSCLGCGSCFCSVCPHCMCYPPIWKVAIWVSRSTVMVSYCLCSSHLYFTKHGLSYMYGKRNPKGASFNGKGEGFYWIRKGKKLCWLFYPYNCEGNRDLCCHTSHCCNSYKNSAWKRQYICLCV
jgi:hypothetical protein